MAPSKEPVIVVTGLPRSGTSLMMQMLEAGGVEILTDRKRKPDEGNTRGYLEFEPVKDLPDDASWLPRARGKAVKVISYLLRFLPESERYRMLLMQRPVGEVLDSQRRFLELRGEEAPNPSEDEELAERFEEHLQRTKLHLLKAPHISTMVVDLPDLLTNPRGKAEEIAAYLDRPLNLDAMAEAVDDSLVHFRTDVK